MTMLPRLSLAATSAVALLAFGGAAFAADISLSNISIAGPDGKTKAEFAKIDVMGTNLTREEVMKLFNAGTSRDDRAAISAKMKADKIDIPQIVITRSDKPGQITVSGVTVNKIDQGKFGKFVVQGFNGKVPVEKNDGDVTFKSGPVTVEDGNLSRAFSALKAGDIEDGVWQFSKFSWQGFEASFPEKTRNGPVYHTIKIGSLVASSKYDGNIPIVGSGEITDMVFIPAANSQAGQSMAIFGYKQVNLGMTFAGTYDPAAKSYKLSDFTFKGADTGVLTISAMVGNVDKAAFTGDKRQRMGALMNGDVDNLKIRFVNNGVFDKAVAFIARMQRKEPDSIRQEWAGMVGGMLPMFLGGDAGAMQSASSVGDFVKNAKNITLTASGKAGPLPFKSFMQMGNPMELLQKLKIEIAANQ